MKKKVITSAQTQEKESLGDKVLYGVGITLFVMALPGMLFCLGLSKLEEKLGIY